ncbi:DNA-binding domain-containing protein [Sporobolomyces salmoneus]|uniref:DNA-binding domain-containing protein n=1 Tax=Sporobolomyces salmoneus TaxID=183962 RepID=UPI00316E7084
MSVAGFSFPQRLRTVSSQLRSAAGLEEPSANYATHDLYSPHGSEWNHLGYPDHQPEAYHDGYGQFSPENGFSDYGALDSTSQGLGFNLSMEMNGIEEESVGYEVQPVKREEGLESAPEARESYHQTRLQTRSTRNQPYATSVSTSFSSSGRSRTSSLASQHSGSIQPSALSSPNSPFFSNPLPSPFRESPGSFSSQASATIDPSASVRYTSPSATSSSSVVTHSRADSTASSPPESVLSSSTAPRRTGSISSRTSARSNTLKHTRKNSGVASPTKNFSPTKGNRSGRRLTNAQRREICLYARAHPNMKQDDIGRVFNYERSTISKTLKEKEHWLSEKWEEPEPNGRRKLGGHRNKSRSVSTHPASDHEEEEGEEEDLAGERTPNLSSLTPQGSPDSPPFPMKGRYPAIDKALFAWAHEQISLGTILSDAALQSQAKVVASRLHGYEAFKASQSWLEGFKSRAGIRDGTFVRHESVSVPAPSMSKHNSRQSISLDDVVGASSKNHVERAEDEEEEEEGERDGQMVEAESMIRRSARHKRPTQASKSLHRLASSQSSFSFDHSRANSPVARSTSDVHGGTFGDISMESESTPTHSTIHSRVATGGSVQPLMLSGSGTDSPRDVTTPSRFGPSAPSSLVLDDHSPATGLGRATYQDHHPQYSYSTELEQSSFVPPYELATFQPHFGTLSTSSSQSSLANFDLGTSTTSSLLPAADYTASPAPSFSHHRSASTASSNSIYSGLTAFSSANGNGTPLTSSAYGSFRTSPGDSCSMPSTPAHGSYFEPSQIPSFAPSPLQQQPMFSSSSSQTFDSTHQRYPNQQPLDRSTSSSTSTSPARRATISGGAPFQGRSSTSTPAPPTPVQQGPAPIQGSVSLDEAYASLKVALSFLGVNEGFARPADFVTFSDIIAKMEDRRVAMPEGVSPAVLSTAPSATLHSSFQRAPSSSNSQTLSNIPSRLKLTRTQSANSVPVYGGGGWIGHSQQLQRSATNSISLAEVDGH